MRNLKSVIIVAAVLLLSLTVYVGFRNNSVTNQTTIGDNNRQQINDQENSNQKNVPETKKFKILSDASLPLDVAATVNGDNISTEDFERRVHKTLFVLKASGNDINNAGEAAIKELREKVVNELIYEKVTMQLAKEFGIVATDQDVEQRINMAKGNYSQNEWLALLESRGINEENLRDYYRTEITTANLINWLGGEEQFNQYLNKKIGDSKVLVNEPVVEKLLKNL